MQKICHSKWIRNGRNSFTRVWLVGFCLLILLPKITDMSVKSLGFVRDVTKVRKFNHHEEEQDVISSGMVIA